MAMESGGRSVTRTNRIALRFDFSFLINFRTAPNQMLIFVFLFFSLLRALRFSFELLKMMVVLDAWLVEMEKVRCEKFYCVYIYTQIKRHAKWQQIN